MLPRSPGVLLFKFGVDCVELCAEAFFRAKVQTGNRFVSHGLFVLQVLDASSKSIERFGVSVDRLFDLGNVGLETGYVRGQSSDGVCKRTYCWR